MATNSELDRRMAVVEAGLKGLGETVNKHVLDCAKASFATSNSLKELSGSVSDLVRDIHEIKSTPMKAVRWLGGLVAAAVISILVQNYWLHLQAQSQTQQIAAAANTAAQQGRAVAQAVGAPIVPAPKPTP